MREINGIINYIVVDPYGFPHDENLRDNIKAVVGEVYTFRKRCLLRTFFYIVDGGVFGGDYYLVNHRLLCNLRGFG